MIDLDAHVRPLDTSKLFVVDAPVQTPRQARRIARRTAARRFVRLQQHQAAADALRPLPSPGETVHGVASGAFSGWSLAQAIVELLGEPVDRMIVATLGFNRENCRELCDLLDSARVREMLLLVSDYFRSSDKTIFQHCRHELERRGQTVAIARSHAKLICCRTPSRSIVCETSANLRSSMNWEQFTISDDAALFGFHADWILDLISEAP